MSEPDLDALVIALETMNLDGLRQVWRQRIGPPPPLRSPDMLRQLLAWRLQAAEFGGLTLEARNLLKSTGAAARGARLSDGARLAREWKGRRYEVERTADGFTYEGRAYRSLSEIAREITGVRWNGPRFFGLRKDQAA